MYAVWFGTNTATGPEEKPTNVAPVISTSNRYRLSRALGPCEVKTSWRGPITRFTLSTAILYIMWCGLRFLSTKSQKNIYRNNASRHSSGNDRRGASGEAG